MQMRCPTLTELPSPPPKKTGWPWTEGSSPQVDMVISSNKDNHQRNWPKVTIVTPVYNQGQFLEETVRSVLLQGYPNIEYIIVDDGSTDHSVEIIRKYEKHLACWTSQENRGQSNALNKGFANATGDIHGYLNSDDIYEPGALHACATAFRNGHRFVVGKVRYFQEGIGYWPVPQVKGNSLAEWLTPCPISQPGCFWASELHRKVGEFREDLRYFMDYEFWLRLRFVAKVTSFFIDQPIAIYRLHPQSKTVAHNARFTMEGKAIQEQYIRLLSPAQRARLWFGLRHHKARRRGFKAVSLFRRSKFRAAIRQLIGAFVVWPLLLVDFYGLLLAIHKLTRQKQIDHAFPQVWPDLDD
jgi:glycosyltransferase involved in cell wall biosynthesis